MAHILTFKRTVCDVFNLDKSLALVAAYNQAVLAARALQKPSSDTEAL